MGPSAHNYFAHPNHKQLLGGSQWAASSQLIYSFKGVKISQTYWAKLVYPLKIGGLDLKNNDPFKLVHF